MVKLYNQISFFDTYEECKDVFQNNKPKSLELLSQHLDLSSLIPQEFYVAYNKRLGRNRQYSANNKIKQLYINSYFCYVYKFGITTNALDIPRHMAFLDNDFKQKHPQMQIDKKSDSPYEDKSISDSKSLKPVLTNFFNLHPGFKPHTFLGDSIFDTYATYPMLLDNSNLKEL